MLTLWKILDILLVHLRKKDESAETKVKSRKKVNKHIDFTQKTWYITNALAKKCGMIFEN